MKFSTTSLRFITTAREVSRLMDLPQELARRTQYNHHQIAKSNETRIDLGVRTQTRRPSRRMVRSNVSVFTAPSALQL